MQGINDLVTPFFQVFLGLYISDHNIDSGMDPGQLPKPVLDAVEADSFWCLSRLLDGIQDNYISAQPGIHRSVKRMQELVARIDRKHLRPTSPWTTGCSPCLINITQPPFPPILTPKMSNSCNSRSDG